MANNCDLGEKLLLNFENIGDVTFSVGQEKEEIKSSVFILRTLSPVFEKMFNENWNGQSSKIELPDIQPQVFRHFLKLLLTSKLTLESFENLKLTIEEILHLFYIANKYDVDSIQQVCRDSVSKRIEIGKAVVIYETVEKMNEPELEKMSFEFITKKIEQIVVQDSFIDFSSGSLCKILKCEPVEIDELELFNGVYRWAEFQCENAGKESNGENIRSVLGEILFLLRFPVMSLESLFEVVHPKEILTSEEIAGISRSIALKGKPGFINECPFSVEDRMKPKKKKYGQCFKFCPQERMSVSQVQFLGGSNLSNWSWYLVRLCISDNDLDNACHESSTVKFGRELRQPFCIEIQPPLVLESEHVYHFQFDIQDFYRRLDEAASSIKPGLQVNHIKFEAVP